jgi:L-fuculose-phosphate aldolase
MREKMARLCRLAYDKELLDSAGGNMTVRTPEGVLSSARYMGSLRQWQVDPDDFLLVDLDGNKLEGDGDISRETRMHLSIYHAFPRAGAVIHTHSKNIQVFVAAGVPIPPMTEQTDKFGPIGFAQHAPQHTQELGDVVVEALKPQEATLEKHAIAVLLPRHGSCIVGPDLDAAYDALERIDRSAYYAIHARSLTAP